MYNLETLRMYDTYPICIIHAAMRIRGGLFLLIKLLLSMFHAAIIYLLSMQLSIMCVISFFKGIFTYLAILGKLSVHFANLLKKMKG